MPQPTGEARFYLVASAVPNLLRLTIAKSALLSSNVTNLYPQFLHVLLRRIVPFFSRSVLLTEQCWQPQRRQYIPMAGLSFSVIAAVSGGGCQQP
jgi:hypothetical protein